jgi:hypothetical protein
MTIEEARYAYGEAVERATRTKREFIAATAAGWVAMVRLWNSPHGRPVTVRPVSAEVGADYSDMGWAQDLSCEWGFRVVENRLRMRRCEHVHNVWIELKDEWFELGKPRRWQDWLIGLFTTREEAEVFAQKWAGAAAVSA